jgi:hypothetical protein
MTSEEIKATAPFDLSTNGWLREVCIQLAQLNEKKPETHANNRSGHTKQRT